MHSAITLRKLQKENIIPKNITPINLKTHYIRHATPKVHTNYLLATEGNIIYYG